MEPTDFDYLLFPRAIDLAWIATIVGGLNLIPYGTTKSKNSENYIFEEEK